MPEDVKKKPVLPKKPDEKSHPDPLKRFKALKEWRKAVNKITGETEMMEWKPGKTLDKAEKELDKAGEKEAKAVQKEVEVKKIGEIEKPLTKEEQIAKLKAIREKNKEIKEQEEKDKKAKEKEKKKKIG